MLGDERCVRRRLRDICRQRASFFLDLDEQPGLNRLHGIAILSDRLPSPARNAILADLHTYLSAILDREWPDMQRRNESRAAGASFQSLWQTVETVNTDPADNQIRGQLLNLLAAAHQSRETRLFQMT